MPQGRTYYRLMVSRWAVSELRWLPERGWMWAYDRPQGPVSDDFVLGRYGDEAFRRREVALESGEMFGSEVVPLIGRRVVEALQGAGWSIGEDEPLRFVARRAGVTLSVDGQHPGRLALNDGETTVDTDRLDEAERWLLTSGLGDRAVPNEPFRFEQDFLDFVGESGFVAQMDDGVTVLANGGGEIRYYVHVEGPEFRVTRAERAESPSVVMTTTDEDLVLRYLTVVLGRGRPIESFLLLWNVDPDIVEPAPGFRLQSLGASGRFALIDPDGRALPIELSQHDAISFSYAAHASLPELYASFRDPEGRPALHDAWTRWRDRRNGSPSLGG